MKKPIEKRKPSGISDYLALTITTFGVGYIPGAPGTYGSLMAVAIYLGIDRWIESMRSGDCLGFLCGPPQAHVYAFLALVLAAFSLVGIWASGRAESMLGSSDPHEAVVDEVLGQLVTFSFIPFGVSWPFIVVGFLLFRLFDIWKPYPIDSLQSLPGGVGVCADDIVAGVYAGICLAVVYAVTLSL
jgi:phosphatidylglycerophosphatase A